MTYRRIRSLSRGIEVLRYLNTVNGAHPADIGKQLGLPRPTVHRVLETLEELELVYQGAYSGEFRLTPGVRRLVGGEDKFSELRAAAWPVMRDLTASLVWPTELAVFRSDAMLIIESTHRLSSMSADASVGGQSRSLLSSSHGRAYLSHSEEERRDMIMARLRAAAPPDDHTIHDPVAIDGMIEAARRNGFSMCEDIEQKPCASLAVPVCMDGEAVASLSIVWNIANMSFDQARERLAGPLTAARNRVEAELRGSAADEPAPHAFMRLDGTLYTRRTNVAVRGQVEPESLGIPTV